MKFRNNHYGQSRIFRCRVPLNLQLHAGGEGGDGANGGGSGGTSTEGTENPFDTFLAQEGNQAEFNRRVKAEVDTALASSKAEIQQAQEQNAAIMVAMELGIGAKTIPYLMKMADLSQAVDQEGKISNEALRNALNKVLEDIPALKPQKQQISGFQFGASGNEQQTGSTDEALRKAFGL